MKNASDNMLITYAKNYIRDGFVVMPIINSLVDGKTQKVWFDMECINSFFCGTGSTCLACGEELELGKCLNPAEHKLDCRLFLTLSPILIHGVIDFGNEHFLSVRSDSGRD
jgi:hypothetical protein